MLRLTAGALQKPAAVRRLTRQNSSRIVVMICCASTLLACEQADRFAGGIDLDAPPPVINGSMIVQAPSVIEAPVASSAAREENEEQQVATGAELTTPSGVAAETSRPAITASRPSVVTTPVAGPLSTPTASSTTTSAGASPIVIDTLRGSRQPRERSALLLNADRAFVTRSGCSEAVRLYASVPRPTDLSGPDGTDWVTAQLRIAQCSIELREWTRSLDAIALVKASRPREWSAAYFEGHVYCQMGQFDRGTKAFRDLTGLLGTLGTGARQAVTLLSKYGAATCDRLDYEASRQLERNKDQLELFLGEYEEFLKGAERMQSSGGVPSEYVREVSSALKSARDNVTKYSKP